MKWTLYVSENDECTNLLYMLNQTQGDVLKKTLKEIKPASWFTTGPYIVSKNKKITKLNKIVAALMPLAQAKQPPRNPNQQYNPPTDFNSNYNYDDSIIGMAGNYSTKAKVADEDDMPANNDKEEFHKRISEMESRRQYGKKIDQSIPDPAQEQKYSESMGGDMYDTIKMEEDLESYFKTTMSGTGS